MTEKINSNNVFAFEFSVYDEKSSKFSCQSEELDLIKKAKKNDVNAIKTLLEMHSGFLIKTVKNYVNYYNPEFEDLLNLAKYGLYDAIQRFDLSKDNKLLTFARWRILPLLEKESRIMGNDYKVTAYGKGQLRKIYASKIRLDPDKKLPKNVLLKLVSEDIEIPLAKIEKLLDSDSEMFRLDAIMSEDSNKEYNEKVASKELDPATIYELEERKSYLKDSINELLDWRQKEIIFRSFGMYGYEEATNIEIAKILEEKFGCKISHERVRQIKNQAMAILKANLDFEMFAA